MTEPDPRDYARLLSQTRDDPTLQKLHWPGKKACETYFLVAAPPKSGSTWVTNVLSRSLSAKTVRYCYAWASNEHDIYAPALLAHQSERTIAQMHMKAAPHNVQFILDFRIRSVVLTRNVYDTVASFARDIQKKADVQVKVPGMAGYSFVWLETCKPDWGTVDWIDYSIDHYLPWYVNFLSSWAAFSKTANALRVRYEELFGDEVAVFQRLIGALDPGYQLDRSSLGRDFTTENVSGTRSETGSGRDVMTAEQIARIDRMFRDIIDPWVLSHLTSDVRAGAAGR